jgi:transglutaminase-like putative cysteine protease
MKRILLFFCVFVQTFVGFAQDNYDADLIPSALRSRANAAIRNEETVVDMRAADNVTYTVKQAITVLNKNGENSAGLDLFYDKNTTIKSIKGEIYNAVGLLEGKFTQRDFLDQSAVHDFSLYEDTRVKRYLPNKSVYPYTIVYMYEVAFKQNLIIPSWMPKPAADVSVEKSSYTFICKPGDKFRIKTQNLTQKAEESTNEKQRILTWKTSNVIAVKTEAYSPYQETYRTFVKIAPENFSYYNHEASYKNWNELGKWIYDDLLIDRTSLPPATVELIKELVKTAKTDKDKARKIYQYLQDKTRYISVQIGIGGFKPFSAADVDRLGYGDCKALVNYMQSLLKAANIDSYYCIVNAGDEKRSLDPSFASMNQANHVILCLPLAGDTTWLECTSQKIPFGFLSSFTDDRLVLACTPSGGKLLHTPKYTAEQNSQKRTATLSLDKNGNIKGTMNTLFTGTQYDKHEIIQGKLFSDQQKLLTQNYAIDNINFDKITYTEKKDELPELQENLSFNIKSYGAVNKNKVFVGINPFYLKIPVQEARNRTMPVYVNRGYTDEDNITYTLDSDFIPIIEPIEKSLQTPFGTYSSHTSIKGNIITHYRKFTLNEGNFAATSYIDFVKFLTDVNTAEQLRYVLTLK